MNFHRRTRRNNTRRNRLIYVLSVLVLCVLLFSVFRGAVVSVVSPLWEGQNFVARGFQSFVSYFRTKSVLVEENQFLRNELAKVELLELSVRTLEGTQEEMLQLFGRGARKDFVASSVLVRPPKTPYDILVIDAGEREGVSVGDDVLLPDGGALGLVSEVYSSGARVILYSSSGMETLGYLERDDTPVKLVGYGGGMLKSDLPRDIEVEVGDKVFLPEIDSKLVAVVEEVNFDTSDSTKEIILRGVVGLGDVRFVEVYSK